MFSKKVAIVYLCWSNEPYKYLLKALMAIVEQTYPKELIEFVIVYNYHKYNEQSACPYIQEQIKECHGELPNVTILEQTENLGFVGGNNIGMQWAIENNCDYVFLHNADGSLGPRAIENLLMDMEKDKKIGAAQSLILLDSDKNLINSAGNNYHFLGFGYCNMYKKNRDELNVDQNKEVSYLSGAAMMIRINLLKQYGLWENDYFIYHDDLEYCLRLHSLGFKTVLVPKSIFYHQYTFSRNPKKYYLMERNRVIVLLTYYKWPTIVLILPLFILMEIGLIIFSILNGWFKQKLLAYLWWFKYRNWSTVLKKRTIRQKQRKVKDKKLFETAVGKIEFEEVNNMVLKYIANPLMVIYWWLAKKIIFW